MKEDGPDQWGIRDGSGGSMPNPRIDENCDTRLGEDKRSVTGGCNSKNQLHGEILFRYSDGKVSEKTTFCNGLPFTTEFVKKPNGSTCLDTTLHRGNGVRIIYFFNGKIRTRESFRDRKKHGRWEEYSKNGEKISVTIWKEGAKTKEFTA